MRPCCLTPRTFWVFKPLNAFAEPEKSIWAAYAASDPRPFAACFGLDVEHQRALSTPDRGASDRGAAP